MEYKNLFSPMNIGKVTIKNRVVMSPMLLGFGQIDGKATEQMMDYYEERAKGGTGLIITEITRVNDATGAGSFGQLGASHDYQIAAMAELAKRVQRHGAKLFIQLHHPGRQNVSLMIGTVPLSVFCNRITKLYEKVLYKVVPAGRKLMEKGLVPMHSVSASKVEPSYFANSKVRALTHSQVKKIIKQFVDAAVRVQKAGCDGIELHGTHGYLIQQFLSPNTNHRKDEYGGSFENRMRFLAEIIAGVREKCGADFPIIVRLTVDECYDRIGKPGIGYSLEEGVKMAKYIEGLGVDALDVSSAAYDTFNYWLEPTSFELGWRKYMAAAVKKAVKIPVLAANLIRSPEQAEEQIAEGTQDFVSLGRPHIADAHWAEKAQSGHPEDIKRCICCLYCIESMMENAFVGSHARCSVNPEVGCEKAAEQTQKDGEGRHNVIVGAGAAGLTAAERLLRRGFAVTVIEKENEVGGQLQLANKPPHKEKIGWCCEDLQTAVIKLGGKIIFGQEATADLLASYAPYAVIVATGGAAIKPRSIKGVERDNVYTSTDILSGKVVPENKAVAVIGSGMTGLETAELLVEHGNKVTIVEMADTVAPKTWFQHVDDIEPKLLDKDTRILLSHKLVEIDAEGVTLECVDGGEKSKLPFDAVVLALGVRSENALYKSLEGKFERLYCVGDASKVGRIANATASGYAIANAIK